MCTAASLTARAARRWRRRRSSWIAKTTTTLAERCDVRSAPTTVRIDSGAPRRNVELHLSKGNSRRVVVMNRYGAPIINALVRARTNWDAQRFPSGPVNRACCMSCCRRARSTSRACRRTLRRSNRSSFPTERSRSNCTAEIAQTLELQREMSPVTGAESGFTEGRPQCCEDDLYGEVIKLTIAR